MTDEQFFHEAAGEAKKATCLRDKCGAVVVIQGKVIGRGWNGPTKGEETKARCAVDLPVSRKPKSDRTCCIHAEWRAIMDAVSSKESLKGSVLYFTRVDADGNILKSGEPYCTVCSRLALDNGIEYFALWHESGITRYPALEYNERSYAFHAQK